MSEPEYPVVFLTREAFRDRSRGPEVGEPVAISIGDDDFLWECPGCGCVYWGLLGEAPVSGWDKPVWRLSGSPHTPTLDPSLGCNRWHHGSCANGHWRLHEGKMIADPGPFTTPSADADHR